MVESTDPKKMGFVKRQLYLLDAIGELKKRVHALEVRQRPETYRHFLKNLKNHKNLRITNVRDVDVDDLPIG